MIQIENTENLAGITISGDYYDFYNLVEAFYAVTISEDDARNSRYFDNSTRVLGLCYDIRHAYMGGRGLSLVDNGMDKNLMEFHSQLTPEKNVYFECHYLYPEMFFVVMAINELLEIYIRKNSKPKNEYCGALNKAVIWDNHIAMLRSLQAAFNQCMKETFTPATYSRWQSIINDKYAHVLTMSGFYLDHHNIEFLKLDKKQRMKKLSTVAKRISEHRYDPLHDKYMREAKAAAEEYDCSPSDLIHPGLEYPDEIEW